jgi:hypothetical protein
MSTYNKMDGVEPYALPQAPDQAPAEQLDRPQGNADTALASSAAFDQASEPPVEPVQDGEPAAPPPRLPRAANLSAPERSALEPPAVLPDWPRSIHEVALYAPPDSEPESALAPIVIERGTGFDRLARFAVMVGAAAIAAYGLALVWSDMPERIESAHRTAPPPTIVAATPEDAILVQGHLIAENRRAFANEPLTLGALVDRTSPGESVLLAGLQAGTRLSAGVSLDTSHWQLPSKRLPDAVVYAPKGFVGVMNTAVNLLSPQGRLIDSEAMQLEWIPKKEAAEPPPARPAPLPDAANQGPAPVAAMDPEQALYLMRQGEDLLKMGDIGAARLAFRRVADAGNADAALALAMTYDPHYLAADGVIGFAGDDAAARIWYQRAKELGSVEANRILAQTFSK